MNTGLRSSLSAGLFQAALVCALLLVPIVTQGDSTFYGSGGETNTATHDSNVALGYAALASDTSYTDGYLNTAIGFYALYYNTTGSYNTANGGYALFSNTSGGGNTATGFEALDSNTTGSVNTATGEMALVYNTTGYENTANGDAALYYNTTGHDNTATGFEALFNTTTGSFNTANGEEALFYNATGYDNTANGNYALYHNTSGIANTAAGEAALASNTTGSYNTATGSDALISNTTGYENTAHGYQALDSNTTGYKNSANGGEALFHNTTGRANTAEGVAALYRNTTGAYNIALGFAAGQYITGNNNIAIGNLGATGESGVIRIGTAGTHNAAFLAGVNSVTISGGSTVYIDTNGQLGILPSSRRFKQDIKDMGNVSDKLMQLRPVTFRYNDRAEKGPHPLQYGLIAEEVAKVYPNLVQYDKAGKPLTVYYHLLTPMLLNEFQKAHQIDQAQKTEIASLKAALQKQNAELASLKQAQEQQRTALTKLAALVEASQSRATHQRTLAMQH